MSQNDDMISRQAAIDAIGEKPFAGTADEYEYEQGLQNQWERDVVAIKILPPAQPELITVNIDHELTQEEYEKLRKDMANAPIMLLPSAQPEAKTNVNGDWVILNKDKILKAGMEGREIEFRIGGRLFSIREKAQ